MAEESGVHPGSWVGDSVEEFKKLPTGGKIAVVAVFLLVGGIGYYEYSKSKSSSSGVSGQTSTSTDNTGTTGAQGTFSTVPGGNTGTVPILPSGYQAIYDAAGNLVAFEPSSSTTTTTSTSTGTTTTTTGTGTTKTGGKGSKGGKSGKGNKGHGGTSSGHAGSQGTGGTHTVKQHQANGSQSKPSVSNAGHTKPKANNKVQANPSAGGAHGYVYTSKAGDTLQNLFAKSWGTQGTPNFGLNYANNKQLLKSQGVSTNNLTQPLKPGTKVVL